MTFYAIIFYILAALLVISTGLAVSRRRLVHAVVFLIISFFATALALLSPGRPVPGGPGGDHLRRCHHGHVPVHHHDPETGKRGDSEKRALLYGPWLPAILLGGISLVLLITLLWTGPEHDSALLKPAMAVPKEFGKYLFNEFWFSIEVVSFLLFVALVGALYLAKENGHRKKTIDSRQEAS